MKQVIAITGASSGFGEMTARELAKAGHVVYASMRETTGRNVPQVEVARKFAAENKLDEIVNGVADRVRTELLRNMQVADLLRPSSTEVPAQKAS